MVVEFDGRVRLSWFSLEIKHVFIGLNVYTFIKYNTKHALKL